MKTLKQRLAEREQRMAQREWGSKLPLVEDSLRRCGLYRTAAALNKAVQAIGYEIADNDRTRAPASARKKGKKL